MESIQMAVEVIKEHPCKLGRGASLSVLPGNKYSGRVFGAAAGELPDDFRIGDQFDTVVLCSGGIPMHIVLNHSI